MHEPPSTQVEYKEFCQELTARLGDIVTKKDALKTLYQLQGNEAQQALDLLKTLLAHPLFPVALRGDIVVAMQRMAKKRILLPRALANVEIIDVLPKYRGGFGEVFRGKYRGRIVCVKKLFPTTKCARERVMQLCAKEAILWGSLNHPNIHRFYGVCELDNHPCLISPWANSGTVMQYLKKHPDADRLKFAADMAEGLKYLHSLRVVHGDIKSANVLIRQTGGLRAVLADFGISSLSSEGIVELTGFSDVYSVGGTVRWQAPELLAAPQNKRNPNTRESDIWALGCTFYEIFVGEPPYPKVALLDIKDHVVRQGKRPQRPDAESPAWRSHGLNEKIWHLFEKCWRTRPSNRLLIERVAGLLNNWIGRDVRSEQLSRRYSPSISEKMAVSSRLKSLVALEGLLATVGSRNDELTDPVIEAQDERKLRPQCGKHPRSFPEKENRANKRAKLNH